MGPNNWQQHSLETYVCVAKTKSWEAKMEILLEVLER